MLRIRSAALRFRMMETDGKKDIPVAKGQQVWILDQEKPKRLFVQTGISEGSYTDVVGRMLRHGQDVIVEAMDPSKKRVNPGAATPHFIR